MLSLAVGWRIWSIRAGTGVLAALNLWWGVWARFWPRPFFESFPGFGHRWTAAYPPFNEHLVTDLGATFLTLGFLLAVAVVTRHRAVRRVVLLAVLVFNALHLSFHAGHQGSLGVLDFGASVAALGAGVIGPLILLAADATGRRDGPGQVG